MPGQPLPREQVQRYIALYTTLLSRVMHLPDWFFPQKHEDINSQSPKEDLFVAQWLLIHDTGRSGETVLLDATEF